MEKQQAELERLRREYEARQTQLSRLSRRKEELQAQLQRVEAEIQGIGRGSAPPKSATSKPAAAKPGGKPAAGVSLPQLLVRIVGQAGRPITAKELAQEALRQKYATTSRDFRALVENRVGELVKKGLLRRAPRMLAAAEVHVNGAKILELKHDEFPPAPGKIGLGVASLNPDSKEGAASFRKIEIKELPPEEPDWVQLFNGKDGKLHDWIDQHSKNSAWKPGRTFPSPHRGALVSAELFAAVAEQLSENRRHYRQQAQSPGYLLQGLVVCGGCGTTGGVGGLFEKMFHYFQFQREDFLAHYHRRSNVESLFSSVKRKFGDSVMNTSDAGMVNEVLCELLCHNLCCLIQEQEELGIVPVFWKNEESDAPMLLKMESPA